MIMQIVIATVASRKRNSLSKLSSNPVLLSDFCGGKPWGSNSSGRVEFWKCTSSMRLGGDRQRTTVLKFQSHALLR